MEQYTAAFFGHRYIDDITFLEERMDKIIKALMYEKPFVTFLVGRNGEFDQIASSAVLRCRRRYCDDNTSLVLVLPYVTAELRNNQESFDAYYDHIEVSHAASQAHPKSAIQIRNREMVDRADLILCYVTQERGGAFQTIRYAKQQGKKIINLAPR